MRLFRYYYRLIYAYERMWNQFCFRCGVRVVRVACYLVNTQYTGMSSLLIF